MGSGAAAGAVLNGACLVLVQAIFGGYAVVLTSLFHGSTMNPWVLALLRDTLASAILLSVAFARRDAARPWIPCREDLAQFFVAALFGVWGSQGLNATAVRLTTGSFVSLLQPGQAIVTFIAAVALGQEPFSLRRWTSYAKLAAVVCAVSGAIALIALSASSSGVVEQSRDLPLGTAYLILQVLCGGLWSPAIKPLLRRYSPLVAVAWVYAIGSVLILLSVLACATSRADWALTPASVAAIAYSGAFTSALNYFLMTWVNSRASPLTVAAFSPLNPVFTVSLSWALLGQAPAASYFVGGPAVICGVVALVAVQQREQSELQREAAASAELAGARGAATKATGKVGPQDATVADERPLGLEQSDAVAVEPIARPPRQNLPAGQRGSGVHASNEESGLDRDSDDDSPQPEGDNARDRLLPAHLQATAAAAAAASPMTRVPGRGGHATL